jgi:hypothetical protein
VFVISLIVRHVFCVLCALAAWREITDLDDAVLAHDSDIGLKNETHAKPPRRKERKKVKHGISSVEVEDLARLHGGSDEGHRCNLVIG